MRKMRSVHHIFVLVVGASLVGCGTTVQREEAYQRIEEILAKYKKVEGHTSKYPQRESCLRSLAAHEDVESIAEIGFNAGHSTVTLLAGNPRKTLTSFDLCKHQYFDETSELMLEIYAGQLEIICGDSTKTLPALIEEGHPPFDLIHIDGGHYGDVPEQDIAHALQLAHRNTFILVDDCNRVQSTGNDGWISSVVNRAWDSAVARGLLEPVDFGSCNIGNCLGRPARKD